MCNWICTFELCPACRGWKRIIAEDVLCEYIASIRGNPQFCSYYKDYDNIIVSESKCEYCANKDDGREAAFDLTELDSIPDVPHPPDLDSDLPPGQDSTPKSASIIYSDSEYEDEDDTSEIYTLGKAVSMSMTRLPIMNETDADATEKASGEVSEEVSKQDSISEFESTSDVSEVDSAFSDEYHHGCMRTSMTDAVQSDDENLFLMEDVFDDEGFLNGVPQLYNPFCHKRVEQLRKDWLH
ncbi:f77cd1ee-8606-450a-8dd0-c797095e2d60 [Sclerotinia trifoliorum]|uniref:F77cd1ee-8606-450a-8dd0-c797095e2d60 n=1 Tax=Sclerotinia trifoliorum TaxID=28548 RepID=A0A8H2W1H0_9HELO|nr:f77cd1ee-8606-450a-8dd0-c797095e2d60 [Sclerotinia trifoliorum]